MNLQEMEKNSAQAVVLLKAMANERRLQILCLLHNQELSGGELFQNGFAVTTAAKGHINIRSGGINVEAFKAFR